MALIKAKSSHLPLAFGWRMISQRILLSRGSEIIRIINHTTRRRVDFGILYETFRSFLPFVKFEYMLGKQYKNGIYFSVYEYRWILHQIKHLPHNKIFCQLANIIRIWLMFALQYVSVHNFVSNAEWHVCNCRSFKCYQLICNIQYY